MILDLLGLVLHVLLVLEEWHVSLGRSDAPRPRLFCLGHRSLFLIDSFCFGIGIEDRAEDRLLCRSPAVCAFDLDLLGLLEAFGAL